MTIVLTIIQVLAALFLIAVVLLQSGKKAGLSGAIAGGAETFFGKNKGRTIDAALKKVTAVVAFLFIISSIVLATYSISANNKANEEIEAQTQNEENAVQTMTDEEGNLVDENGNILITAEQLAEAQKSAEAEKTAE